MAVVWIPSLLQTLTGGDRTVTVPGATLREVIDNLDARYPGIKTRLLDDNGRLQPDVAAAIDGETEHFGLLEPVRDTSEVHFIPAISGGTLDLMDRIVTDPAILTGKPTIRGTRIAVDMVLEYLEDNLDLTEFFLDYPELTPADVQACLGYAKTLVQANAHRKSGHPVDAGPAGS